MHRVKHAIQAVNGKSDKKTELAFSNAIGNITSKQEDGEAYTYVYSSAKPHAVQSITRSDTNSTYTQDENGNRTYAGDVAGNLPANISTTDFVYDGEAGVSFLWGCP